MAKKKYNVIREEMLQVASNVAQEKNIEQDSVFSAIRLKELMITEIIKPLKRSEANITNNDEIIAPRLIPKNPLFHTSVKSSIKFSIVLNF